MTSLNKRGNPPSELSLCGVALLDGFGYLGTVATFGFIVAYLRVAIGAPVFLHRRHLFRPYHALLAVNTAILLAIPLVGGIYPLPAWHFIKSRSVEYPETGHAPNWERPMEVAEALTGFWRDLEEG